MLFLWKQVLDISYSPGYTQSTADPSIYSKIELRDRRECSMIVAVYVDDTILASNDESMAVGRKLYWGGGGGEEIF